MLKQATIFKDFRISTNATNTAVQFTKVSPLSISVKNDNFSSQVQILDNADTTDLFDYKYITFDNSAVFEIKDCIKNEKYTTIFIQYLSNITFDEANANFRVDAVSAATLQRLGLNVNEFLQILGNAAEIKRVNYIAEESSTDNFLMLAIRLRYSELPQNLSKCYYMNESNVPTIADIVDNLNVKSEVYNPSIANINQLPQDNQLNETSADNATVVIIPIPIHETDYFSIFSAYSHYYSFTYFVNTLSTLITDLTLSAEIIILTNKTITLLHDGEPKYMTFRIPGRGFITLPDVSTDLNNFLNLVRFPSTLYDVATNKLKAAPCFVMGGKKETISSINKTYIFYEFFEYKKIILPVLQSNEAYTTLSILNNDIDISQIKNDYIYIKRENGKIRIYVDIERNIYTDIITTLEFAKNAYSNYEAYTKSNIELVNNQNIASLNQQQQQQRKTQTLDNVISGANSFKNAAFSLGMGSPLGAIGALVGGGIEIAADEAKFNLSQQNATANQKLAASQAMDKLRTTIVPSSDLKGSVNLTTVLQATDITTLYKICFITLSKIVLTDMQKYSLIKYAFDNIITEKITSIAQIKKPAWQTVNNCYQVKLCNVNPLNTRKDLIIFVEDSEEI